MIMYILLFFSFVLQVNWLVNFGLLKPYNDKHPALDKDVSTILYEKPPEKTINITG